VPCHVAYSEAARVLAAETQTGTNPARQPQAAGKQPEHRVAAVIDWSFRHHHHRLATAASCVVIIVVDNNWLRRRRGRVHHDNLRLHRHRLRCVTPRRRVASRVAWTTRCVARLRRVAAWRRVAALLRVACVWLVATLWWIACCWVATVRWVAWLGCISTLRWVAAVTERWCRAVQ
jgi:hypothetical protein